MILWQRNCLSVIEMVFSIERLRVGVSDELSTVKWQWETEKSACRECSLMLLNAGEWGGGVRDWLLQRDLLFVDRFYIAVQLNTVFNKKYIFILGFEAFGGIAPVIHAGSTSGRNNTCHKCGKSYASRDSLRMHLKCYCGLQPQFCCMICPKRFYQKVHLQRHMVFIHKFL